MKLKKSSRVFSIFLLKLDASHSKTLAELTLPFVSDHKLIEDVRADKLPEGARIFVSDTEGKPPWWKDFFGVKIDLEQVLKGAILLVPIGQRIFALCFGHVSHILDDAKIEYDFGLKVALNALDPRKLNSADKSEPHASRNVRTQLASPSMLTFFDFDTDSEILKSLTGKVRIEFEEEFKTVTGSSSLRVNMAVNSSDITHRLTKLLALYDRDDYKTNFPGLQNITPVKDTELLTRLDELLLGSLKAMSSSVKLLVPQIVNYHDYSFCSFRANGYSGDRHYSDITIESFYEFLGEEPLLYAKLSELKSWKLDLTNDDGFTVSSHSLYRSIAFETNLSGDMAIYHLSDGKWYRVSADYVQHLTDYLDEYCVPNELPSYNHDNILASGKRHYSEAKYNSDIPNHFANAICLDQTTIAPKTQTEIEPCDVYRIINIAGTDHIELLHIKISTRSSQLSHLFSQALVSLKLLLSNHEARVALDNLVANATDSSSELRKANVFNDESRGRVLISLGIITHLPESDKSKNLPLFTKINLRSRIQEIRLLGVGARVFFIPDASPKKEAEERDVECKLRCERADRGDFVFEILDGPYVGKTIVQKRRNGATKAISVGDEFQASIYYRKNKGSADLAIRHD
jgi:uncharacterized protein (TIGR04141 family)